MTRTRDNAYIAKRGEVPKRSFHNSLLIERSNRRTEHNTAIMNTTKTKLTVTTASEEMRCRYPSKRCEQTRAVKRDGDFHRFCDFHRTKANLNQQRLEHRRKLSNPSPPKRIRSNSRTKSNSVSDESYAFKPEPEVVTMPSLHVKDMDLELDILSELLDLPDLQAFGLDETDAALHLLDTEFATADLMGLSVQW